MKNGRFVISTLALLMCITPIAAETRVTMQRVPNDGKRAKTVMDDRGNTHLIFNKQGNIFYTRKNPETSSFAEPIQVNTIDGCAAIGEIAVGRNGRVHVLFHGNIFYIREKIKTENRKVRASDVKYTFYGRLNDAGDAFEEQRDVSGGVWGFDGGCAIAADENGNVYQFFNGTLTPGGEQSRHVFMRQSSDDGETFSRPRPIDLGKGVCPCCYLKAQITKAGDLMLAYRVAEEGVNRDSYVLASTDKGKTFTASPLDKWKLRACPGSVYSFANVGDSSFVSWRTENEIYLSLTGAGTEISPPGKSMNRRAAVLGSNQKGEVLMAWAEGTNFNQPHNLQWQLYDQSGKAIGDVGVKENILQRWGNAAIYSKANGDFVILY